MSRETDRKYIIMAFRIIADFGVTIAVPVVLFTYLGRKLDAYSGVGPWCTVLGFVVAAGLTTVLIRRKANWYGQEYSALMKEEQTQKHTHTPPNL